VRTHARLKPPPRPRIGCCCGMPPGLAGHGVRSSRVIAVPPQGVEGPAVTVRVESDDVRSESTRRRAMASSFGDDGRAQRFPGQSASAGLTCCTLVLPGDFCPQPRSPLRGKGRKACKRAASTKRALNTGGRRTRDQQHPDVLFADRRHAVQGLAVAAQALSRRTT